MTQPDKLTIEQVDALVAEPRLSQADNNIAAVAKQLADTMRENERLARENYELKEKDGLRQALRKLDRNKDSDHG